MAILEKIISLDILINQKMPLIHGSTLNKIMFLITNIVSIKFLIFLLAILLIVLIYKKRFYNVLLLTFGLAGGVSLELLLKAIVQRLRPENTIIETSNYSLPSGHATTAIIFFSLLIYFFKDGIKEKFLRYSFIIINIILIILIGFSRIYLCAHWFSDVIIGYLIGVMWMLLLILILKKINKIYK